MWIAQTIGIEGLVGLLLAAGEALFIPAYHSLSHEGFL